MVAMSKSELSADQVLVTVGTVCGVSSVGTVETQRALIRGDRRMIGFAAFDAGLVDVEVEAEEPNFFVRAGERRGQPIAVEEIEERWGTQLRADMGVRVLKDEFLPPHLPGDLG